MNRLSQLGLLLLTLLMVGCSTQTQIYNVSVRNDTSQPITVWMCKDGPPLEDSWRSPEQLAMQPMSADERLPAVVVPVGKTADTGPVQGRFDRATRAWLRIYAGEQKLSQILAISKGSLIRQDVVLSPGKNRLIVDDTAGALNVHRAEDSAK